MRRITVLLLVSIAIGSALGLLFPKPSEAIILVNLYAHPGATNTLNCGWHGACTDPPTSGNALDWSNGENSAIYWRSYGERSDYLADIARGTIWTEHSEPNGCRRVRVDVRDVFNFDKGSIRYTHSDTTQAGQQFYIYGSPSRAWTSRSIGKTVWDGRANCSWDGYHLHQFSSGWPWYDNWSRYPYAPSGGSYPVTNWGYHQSLQGWCWYC